MWALAGLLLVGVLLAACSVNKGPAGPQFRSGQTGEADTSDQVRVQVAVNAGSIERGRRAGITVLVSNVNGRPLEGRLVQISTTQGQIDQVDGFTDSHGKFSTAIFFPCNLTAGITALIRAFSEGSFNAEPVPITVAPDGINSPCL